MLAERYHTPVGDQNLNGIIKSTNTNSITDESIYIYILNTKQKLKGKEDLFLQSGSLDQ